MAARSKLLKAFRNNLVVGLVLIAPLFITGFIVHFLIKLVAGNSLTRAITNALFTLMPESMRDGSLRFLLGQMVSLILVIICIAAVGFFVRSFLGRRLYKLAEKILVKIPVFNKIYVQVRHISETIFSQRQTMFQEVVLLEYPRKGLFSVGFVTSAVPPRFSRLMQEDGTDATHVALFIPTTPNPTSGLMIFAPRADVRPLPISVPDAMKLIISGGSVYPGDEDVDNRPTLLDKLEAWITRETNLEPLSTPGKPEDKS